MLTKIQTTTSVDIDAPITRLTSPTFGVVDNVCGACLTLWSSRSRAAVETDAGEMVAQWRVSLSSTTAVTRRTLQLGVSGTRPVVAGRTSVT